MLCSGRPLRSGCSCCAIHCESDLLNGCDDDKDDVCFRAERRERSPDFVYGKIVPTCPVSLISLDLLLLYPHLVHILFSRWPVQPGWSG